MDSNSDNIFVGDCDQYKSQDPLDYRLRVATKRTDLPIDVIRLLAEAYAKIIFLEKRDGITTRNTNE
jgi:hypothetical protein